MTNLSERRKKIDLKFLYKIVNGIINCPELLSCFNFNAPHGRNRSNYTFYITFKEQMVHLSCSSINRIGIMKLANDVQVDLFNFFTFECFYNYIYLHGYYLYYFIHIYTYTYYIYIY